MFVFSEAHLADQRAISNEKSEKHFETLRSFLRVNRPNMSTSVALSGRKIFHFSCKNHYYLGHIMNF